MSEMNMTKEEMTAEAMKLDHQLCFPLYAAARQVTSLYTPFLKPLGLTYTQYIVFLALWEKDNITVGELGKRLYLDNGTLTPLLKKLQQNSYILRERSCDDERVVNIRLTEKGRSLREKAAEIPFHIASCLAMKPEDAAMLHSLLYRLLRGNAPE